MRFRGYALLATGAVLAALLTPVAGTGAAQAAAPAPPPEKILVQNLAVAWAGKDYKGAATATAVVPGIGNLRVVCKRDSTMVQLQATNRNAENQMWLAKYETKNDEPVVAVKTVRIYKYATRGDTTGSGTGPAGHEGLNQIGRIENQASGYLHGVISQRPARNANAANAAVPPATSFKLNWYWNGFRKAAKDSSCSISARFVTNVTDTSAAASAAVKASKSKVVKVGKKNRRVGRVAAVTGRASTDLSLNWHGNADGENESTRTATIPSIGDVELTCEPGREGRATLTLAPAHPNSSMYVERVTGEGEIDDHVDGETLTYDPVLGVIGPVDLPSNGMLRVYFSVNGKTNSIIVSSYRKTNDLARPELNVCEVATAPWLD